MGSSATLPIDKLVFICYYYTNEGVRSQLRNSYLYNTGFFLQTYLFIESQASHSQCLPTVVGCWREIYPLDEAIGLGSEKKYTLGVRERALWAEVSYEKSEEFLKKFTGLEVSRTQIHNLAVEEGGEDSRYCGFEEIQKTRYELV